MKTWTVLPRFWTVLSPKRSVEPSALVERLTNAAVFGEKNSCQTESLLRTKILLSKTQQQLPDVSLAQRFHVFPDPAAKS
jgi:hypothetical protein